MADLLTDADDPSGAYSQAATQLQQGGSSWAEEEDDEQHLADSDHEEPGDAAADVAINDPTAATISSEDEAALAEADDAAAVDVDGAVQKGAPLKAPSSAYFLFCAEHRQEVRASVSGRITEVAKALGQRWKQLTAEERLPYETKAKEAKAAYLKHKASLPTVKLSKVLPSSLSLSPSSLSLPHASIKRLIHLDPSIKRASKEAALTLTCSTEAFLSYLTSASIKVAAGRKRRRLQLEDVMAVVEGNGGLEFLRSEMRKIKKDVDALHEKERKEREDRAQQQQQHAAANAPQLAEGEKENQPTDEVKDGQADDERLHDLKKEGKQRKKKGSIIDVKHYQSLTAMFSKQHQQQQQTSLRPLSLPTPAPRPITDGSITVIPDSPPSSPVSEDDVSSFRPSAGTKRRRLLADELHD